MIEFFISLDWFKSIILLIVCIIILAFIVRILTKIIFRTIFEEKEKHHGKISRTDQKRKITK